MKIPSVFGSCAGLDTISPYCEAIGAENKTDIPVLRSLDVCLLQCISLMIMIFLSFHLSCINLFAIFLHRILASVPVYRHATVKVAISGHGGTSHLAEIFIYT
jgi:hypothetical protein